jgi:hypothetical protein
LLNGVQHTDGQTDGRWTLFDHKSSLLN